MKQNNKNRPGYKKTPVGWIPEDWEESKLIKIAKINPNSLKENTSTELSFYYIELGMVREGIIQKPQEKIFFIDAPSRARRQFADGDILFSTVRPNLKGFAYVEFDSSEFICSTGFSVIRVQNKYNAKFVYYNLFSHNAEKYFFGCVVGSGYPALNNSDVENWKIPLPSLQEQCKISSIISTWDQAIEQTINLIAAKRQLKKGLMQQLLTGRMRFPEFGLAAKHKCELPSGWKEAELNTIFKISKRKNSKGCKHVLTASGQNGLVDQKDFFNRSVAGKNLSNYYLLEHGEFAYNRSAMKGFPYGAIKRLEKYDEGVLSTLYLCFNLKSKTVDSDFINYYFESGIFNIQLRKIIEVGARAHGLLNITATDFMHLKVQLPEQTEQIKISKTLSLIDNEIDCLKRRESILFTQRKELLNKLLSGSIRVKINNGR